MAEILFMEERYKASVHGIAVEPIGIHEDQ